MSWLTTFAMLAGYLCGNFIGCLMGFSAGQVEGIDDTLGEVGEKLAAINSEFANE